MRQVNPVLLNQLKADYLALQQLGSPILSSQGMLVPRNMPEMRMLITNSIRPIVSNGDPARTEMPGGFTLITASTPMTAYTGTVQMLVTEAGHDQMFAELVVASGGMVDCDYYDGRVDSFTRSYELLNCAIRFEQAEFDSEGRSNVMRISCPMDYNYFGSFANIGNNGTVLPGQRQISGVQDLVNRVQQVINVAQAATNIANASIGVTNQIGNLFG